MFALKEQIGLTATAGVANGTIQVPLAQKWSVQVTVLLPADPAGNISVYRSGTLLGYTVPGRTVGPITLQPGDELRILAENLTTTSIGTAQLTGARGSPHEDFPDENLNSLAAAQVEATGGTNVSYAIGPISGGAGTTTIIAPSSVGLTQNVTVQGFFLALTADCVAVSARTQVVHFTKIDRANVHTDFFLSALVAYIPTTVQPGVGFNGTPWIPVSFVLPAGNGLGVDMTTNMNAVAGGGLWGRLTAQIA